MSDTITVGGETPSPAAEPLGDFFRSLVEGGGVGRYKSWYNQLVASYLRYHYTHRVRASGDVSDEATETERAHAVIRRACIRSAVTGAAAGVLSTGATVFTAETSGVGGLLALPAAALAIGGEMLYRSVVHLELTCDLADIFGIRFDPDDPRDLWRLYALAFKTEEHEDSSNPGRQLLQRVTHLNSKEAGEEIGRKLLGESLLRNAVPFFGIAASAVSSWRLTRRIGDTVRRYARYRRALHDALARDEKMCAATLDLFIEGMWFIFTADGQLCDEEAAVLVSYLRRVDATVRDELSRRFAEEEHDWIERLRQLPAELRAAHLHALYVAAAVDKSVSLPEQKLLRRAAEALGHPFEMRALEEMIREFEAVGVLAGGQRSGSPATPPSATAMADAPQFPFVASDTAKSP